MMQAELGRKTRYTFMLQCAFSICFEPEATGTNFSKLILSEPFCNKICHDSFARCSEGSECLI